MFDYIVQPGDTLNKIADYFDVSIQAIINANPGLNPDYLYIGQQLRIPISRFLYQSYPWYYLYPYLFVRYPRRHWDDRRRWPSGSRNNDGRRDRNGWWNTDGWRNPDGWRNIGNNRDFDGRRDFDGNRGFGGRRDFDGRRGRQMRESGSLSSPEQEMRTETLEHLE
ncbi:MAG: LysM peptidoglycan-binding domain-containing protein [Oscillospiraceae bacterium]|nr:LysM peptidoglycan-binding domain-containing protein [Oscillospiraceae bacterium]